MALSGTFYEYSLGLFIYISCGRLLQVQFRGRQCRFINNNNNACLFIAAYFIASVAFNLSQNMTISMSFYE